MADFIFLMHGDAKAQGDWPGYLTKLRATGKFEGGSAVGGGVLMRKSGVTPDVTKHITGYLIVEADDLAHAQTMVAGNPVFEGGGTVEIRELPRTD